MNPRLNVGKGVTGAVRYVLGEGRDPKTGELKSPLEGGQSRVAWISGANLGFQVEGREDADLARRVMEFDAMNQSSKTRRCEKDCVHLSIGWRPGETPTRDEMEGAAHDALKALGMGNAKAIFVAHNDEDYAHVHIVASKINPATDRAYDLEKSYLKLSAWAEKYEREHGGIINLGRSDANELRQAITDRDAGAVLDLMTKQRSTFTVRELDRALGKQIPNDLERGQFANAVLDHREAVHLSDREGGPVMRYSTRGVIEAEQHVLRAASALAGDMSHQVNPRAAGAVLSSGKYDGMTGEQTRAFRHATGGEGLALIDGQAGTGKSYTLAAIREAYEASGRKVIGLAPTNAVAQDMKRDGFARAATLHSELFALNTGRRSWDKNTVVIVDEAAMLGTKMMTVLTARAEQAGAKLIIAGDDRQLSSIDRGGMFGALKERHGAAALTEVKRQQVHDDRRAAEMMAEGNFAKALGSFEAQGAIHWTRTQPEARAALVDQWTKDSAAEPTKSRFVFAYTNDDVTALNKALRGVQRERGALGEAEHSFETRHGRADFSTGDRIQFTGTDKTRGLINGAAGTIKEIEGAQITVQLDGKKAAAVTFDAGEFQDFRHGYAGTIYKGQGRTIDQTYLYHSDHWRASASYVALTRHRDTTALFVARNTAKDLGELGRQLARKDERRAASQFFAKQELQPVRKLDPQEILARFGEPRPPRMTPIEKTQQRDAPQEHRAIEREQRRDEQQQQRQAAEPRPVKAMRKAAEGTFGKGARATESNLTNALGAVEGLLEGLLGFLAGGKPKLTPEQQRLEDRANEEKHIERAAGAKHQAREADRQNQLAQTRKQQQESNLQSAMQAGGPATAEAQLDAHRSGGRTRGRTR